MKIYIEPNKNTKGILLFFITLSISVFCLNHVAYTFEEVKFVRELRTELKEPIDTAVSQTGDVYVLDKKLCKVFVFDPEGKIKFSFGKEGSQLGELDEPQSLALSLNGEIVVSDTGNSRVQVYGPSGHFAYEIGNLGTGPGEFKSPNSVAVDQSGNIYVADIAYRTISKFSPNGCFLKAWSVKHEPTDIVFDAEQNMYVLFAEGGKVVKYPSHSGKIQEITLSDDTRNYISSAASLAVDMRGDIYLMELGNHSVIKIGQNESFLLEFGSKGVGKGQFDKPAGITADSQGNIYIADSRNKRVQVLNISGSQKEGLKPAGYILPVIDYEKSIYTGDTVVDINYVPNQGLYVLRDHNAQILLKGENSKRIGKSDKNGVKLRNPMALYASDDGKILVADTGNHRLLFLNQDGTYIYHFGRKGDDRSEFNALQGVAADKQGYIYVADTNNNRIQVFNGDGIFLKSFGKKSEQIDEHGAAQGTFLKPKDLVFNSKEHLYVLDYKNKRIQIFEKNGKYLKEIGDMHDGMRFIEPIDIDIDEKDYLYVADRGSHSIKIFDPQGKFVIQFGSSGKGPSYFPQISAIASSNNKIYVSDYSLNSIKVFGFKPKTENKEEFNYLTRVSYHTHFQ
ncbi:MAG: NHL repeat-containing protein [Candidatus Scalinduaceae bacterium]